MLDDVQLALSSAMLIGIFFCNFEDDK